MANRFALDCEEGFRVVYFGLVNRANLLLDSLTCIFPEYTLKRQRENLVQYSDQIGLPKEKIPKWDPPRRESKDVSLPVVDFIHVSNWDDAHAEICFWNYSQGHIADMMRARKKDGLTPWGIALLRCEIDLQRAFLDALYRETESQ
jgi:hypothetical protein